MAAATPQITSRVLGIVETAGRIANPPEQGRQPKDAKVTTRPMLKPVEMAQATVSVNSEKRVSLNFLGADINDVLKALALQSGENIVASKDVKGEVTVSLSNVSMEDALDYITNPNGLSYLKNNETYLISVKNTVVPVVVSENVSEVFALHYAKAEEVIGIFEKLFPDIKVSGNKGGDATKKDSPANAIDFIAVSASADRIVEIRNVVKQLEDSIQTNMASLKTEVYIVKYADPKTIAESITKLVPGVLVGLVPASGFAINSPGNVDATNSGGATVTTRIEQPEAKNPNYQSLVLSGPAEQVVRAKDLAAQLDVKSPLISIEAQITSINKAGEEKIGLKWNWSLFKFNEFVNLITPPLVDIDGKPIADSKPLFGPTDKYVRDPLNFSAVLDALVTNGNAKVLASPNLLCMDGMPGVFFVGDEVTYIERIETTPTGQNIKTQTKQVGVQLRVVGDASPDGYITLNLHPEVSTLQLNVQSGVSLPIVSRRYTDHVVRVKNGQTIAIGGLIRSDEIQNMSKVPFLSDIPFLGKLFQHKSKSKSETEVVMFITAKVVED
ncbi:MAG: hypothetical protein NT018_12740, partial [Armatimonadetes bacterium]|nr:hypothetical protein [Armatimonadota bacterium]